MLHTWKPSATCLNQEPLPVRDLRFGIDGWLLLTSYLTGTKARLRLRFASGFHAVFGQSSDRKALRRMAAQDSGFSALRKKMTSSTLETGIGPE